MIRRCKAWLILVSLAAGLSAHESLAASTAPGIADLIDKSCPERSVARSSPAAMLDLQDNFRASLQSDVKKRLDGLLGKSGDNGGVKICEGHDGASCDVKAYNGALEKMGLSRPFVTFACKAKLQSPAVIRRSS